MLPGVGQLEWTYETTGVVSASPERVMAWWYDPGRSHESLRLMERVVGHKISMTQSTVDDLRIRDLRWKDRQGGDRHHHIETQLSSDGMPLREGDLFVAPGSESFSLQLPSGHEMTRTCEGGMRFLPLPSGATEVSFVHHHILVGGNRLDRWSHSRSERANGHRMFRDLVAQCQNALDHLAT
jgi:hypothetical protein